MALHLCVAVVVGLLKDLDKLFLLLAGDVVLLVLGNEWRRRVQTPRSKQPSRRPKGIGGRTRTQTVTDEKHQTQEKATESRHFPRANGGWKVVIGLFYAFIAKFNQTFFRRTFEKVKSKFENFYSGISPSRLGGWRRISSSTIRVVMIWRRSAITRNSFGRQRIKSAAESTNVTWTKSIPTASRRGS